MEQQWKSIEMDGEITAKYLDSLEHNYKTIRILGEIKKKQVFEWDNSGLFEFLEVGDSLNKEKDTLGVVVIRNGEKHFFIIDSKCERFE